ncbi:MAG: DUF1902 domain-containing protein [Deltaproteobacteria bacterium]|jgi:hypothetical protein|nr:DUF1902 domain-containing protein [Deltaproteobacteria bacterium]
MQELINFNVIWDAEAEVWIALSPELPGFGLESDKFEVLLQKVFLALPEFLELNRAVDASSEKRELSVKFSADQLELFSTVTV